MSSFALTGSLRGFRLSARATWQAPCAALFGASGSGKSTILEAIAGVRPEVSGPIELAGRRLDSLAPCARSLGWVPQDAALFPHLSVRENLSFAARAPIERGSELDGAIEALLLGPLLDRRASEISGGERQRVALARAIASRPSFLLLDEPLASLDRPLRARVVEFLSEWRRGSGVPWLLVSHDPLEVLALADHVMLIEDGEILASGDPRAVFAAAASFAPLVAIGAENVFGVRVLARGAGTLRVETEAGTELVLASVPGFPVPSRVAVRSEEILLAREKPAAISAQNVFAGRVRALEPIGEQVLVRLDVRGECWTAKVTRGAVERLGIEANAELVLIVKAHAILPQP